MTLTVWLHIRRRFKFIAACEAEHLKEWLNTYKVLVEFCKKWWVNKGMKALQHYKQNTSEWNGQKNGRAM